MSIHSEQDLIKQQLANLNDEHKRNITVLDAKINEISLAYNDALIKKQKCITDFKMMNDTLTTCVTDEYLNNLINDELIKDWQALINNLYTERAEWIGWVKSTDIKCEKIIAVCNLILTVTVTDVWSKLQDTTILVSVEDGRSCNGKNNALLYKFMTILNKRANTTHVAIYPNE